METLKQMALAAVEKNINSLREIHEAENQLAQAKSRQRAGMIESMERVRNVIVEKVPDLPFPGEDAAGFGFPVDDKEAAPGADVEAAPGADVEAAPAPEVQAAPESEFAPAGEFRTLQQQRQHASE